MDGNERGLRALGMPPCSICGVCMVQDPSGSVELDGQRWRCLSRRLHQSGTPKTYTMSMLVPMIQMVRTGVISFIDGNGT